MSRFLRVRAPFVPYPELSRLNRTFQLLEYGQPGYSLVADSPFIVYNNGFLYEQEIDFPRYRLSREVGRERLLRVEFDMLAEWILLNRMTEIDPELLAVRCLEVHETIIVLDYNVNIADAAAVSRAHRLC